VEALWRVWPWIHEVWRCIDRWKLAEIKVDELSSYGYMAGR
jgi:hypothetical protein